MAHLDRWVIPLTRALAIVGVAGLMVQAGLTLADVLLRWLANAPIEGLEDINGLAIVIVIAACIPIVVARRQNISITFLGDAFGARGKAWLEASASVSVLVFLVLVGWQLSVYCAELAAAGRTTWLLELPVTPYWIVATAVYATSIPVQAIIVVADVARAFAGAPPPAPDAGDGSPPRPA